MKWWTHRTMSFFDSRKRLGKEKKNFNAIGLLISATEFRYVCAEKMHTYIYIQTAAKLFCTFIALQTARTDNVRYWWIVISQNELTSIALVVFRHWDSGYLPFWCDDRAREARSPLDFVSFNMYDFLIALMSSSSIDIIGCWIIGSIGVLSFSTRLIGEISTKLLLRLCKRWKLFAFPSFFFSPRRSIYRSDIQGLSIVSSYWKVDE